MRRILIGLFLTGGILLVVAVLALVLWGDAWVVRATQLAIPRLIAASQNNPVGALQQVRFARAEWTGLRSAFWSQVTLELQPAVTARHPALPRVRVRVERVRARVAGLFPLRASVRLEGIKVDSAVHLAVAEDVPFASDEFDVPVERIDQGEVTIDDLPLRGGWQVGLQEVAAELNRFMREGQTTLPLTLAARLHFRLHGVPMIVRMETLQRAGQTWLRLNREDLDRLSKTYYRPLTERERELLAAQPVKAPTLLRIKEYAESASRRLAAADPGYNEDSTRHVLWSYWLNRTFGPEFANQVTEAHEVGSDNTPEESARDRSNNALGKEFAVTKKTEGQVVHLAKTDPRVVK